MRRVNGTMPRLIVPARPGQGLSMLELLNNTGGTSARGADKRRPCGTRTENRSRVRRAGMPQRKCKETEWARQAGRGLVVDQLLACLIIGWQYLLIHRDTLVLLRREGGIRVYIVRDLLISRTPVRSALSAANTGLILATNTLCRFSPGRTRCASSVHAFLHTHAPAGSSAACECQRLYSSCLCVSL